MKTWLVVVSVVAVLLAASTGVGFWMWSDAEAELTDTKAELVSTEAELVSTETELASTEAELTQIKEVYPPRHFETYDELADWVYEHTPFTYTPYTLLRRNLELQSEALADGYFWSVSYNREDEIISVVIAGDSVYWVWPDGQLEWIASR